MFLEIYARAQRLSASSEFSRKATTAHHRQDLSACSTPFGIIGILTAEFLVAFDYELECAQRLSASSEFSHSPRPKSFLASHSAQRLSASSEFSLRGCQPNCFPHVTNCVFTHR